MTRLDELRKDFEALTARAAAAVHARQYHLAATLNAQAQQVRDEMRFEKELNTVKVTAAKMRTEDERQMTAYDMWLAQHPTDPGHNHAGAIPAEVWQQRFGKDMAQQLLGVQPALVVHDEVQTGYCQIDDYKEDPGYKPLTVMHGHYLPGSQEQDGVNEEALLQSLLAKRGMVAVLAEPAREPARETLPQPVSTAPRGLMVETPLVGFRMGTAPWVPQE